MRIFLGPTPHPRLGSISVGTSDHLVLPEDVAIQTEDSFVQGRSSTVVSPRIIQFLDAETSLGNFTFVRRCLL